MIVIGIDPGLSGGLAVLGGYGDESFACRAAPFTTISEVKSLLADLYEEGYAWRLKVFIEEPPAFFKGARGGLASQAKLHRSLGQYEGLLMGFEIPFETVTPQKWQKGLPGLAGLAGKERKKALHNLASQRHPQLRPTLKTCDAILIAEYGRRKEGGNE